MVRRFLYDERALVALIKAAHPHDIQVNSYETSPWQEYLVAERDAQSIYVNATKR